jgi:hypothetical protein
MDSTSGTNYPNMMSYMFTGFEAISVAPTIVDVVSSESALRSAIALGLTDITLYGTIDMSATLYVTSSLHLFGTANAQLRSTLSGYWAERAIYVSSSGYLRLENVTMANFYAGGSYSTSIRGGAPMCCGGALYIDGHAEVFYSSFINNRADPAGANNGIGGAVYVADGNSSFSCTGCEFASNSAPSGGANVYNDGCADCAALYPSCSRSFSSSETACQEVTVGSTYNCLIYSCDQTCTPEPTLLPSLSLMPTPSPTATPTYTPTTKPVASSTAAPTMQPVAIPKPTASPTPTPTTSMAVEDQCIDCGSRLTGRKLLFGYLNCC